MRYKQRKERRSGLTFFLPLPPLVFSPGLASDATSRISRVMNDFVVAGRKNDALAFTLDPAFFSLENAAAKIWW
jgi:hypothetical protein